MGEDFNSSDRKINHYIHNKDKGEQKTKRLDQLFEKVAVPDAHRVPFAIFLSLKKETAQIKG